MDLPFGCDVTPRKNANFKLPKMASRARKRASNRPPTTKS
jgi:hypothetical protein